LIVLQIYAIFPSYPHASPMILLSGMPYFGMQEEWREIEIQAK